MPFAKTIKRQVCNWISHNFSQPNHVIELNRVDEIIAKGEFPVTYFSQGYPKVDTITFRFRMKITNGMYKVISDSICYKKNQQLVMNFEMSLSEYEDLSKDQAESSSFIRQSVNNQL